MRRVGPPAQTRDARIKLSAAPPFDAIADFLREIGLHVEHGGGGQAVLLPGIAVQQGSLSIDAQALSHPCDLRHEAGHLAVIPAAQRTLLYGDVTGLNASVIEMVDCRSHAFGHCRCRAVS